MHVSAETVYESLKTWVRALALHTADSRGTSHVLVIWPVSLCFVEDLSDVIRALWLCLDHTVSWCGYGKHKLETERLLGNRTLALRVRLYNANNACWQRHQWGKKTKTKISFGPKQWFLFAFEFHYEALCMYTNMHTQSSQKSISHLNRVPHYNEQLFNWV